jgi:hypothetical protein
MIKDTNIKELEDANDDIWVFVSHSTKDFEKVRILRNKMEEIGMRQLLFYLKCLKDKPEVIELLKREIDVRPRFLLCDSPNARKSEYVGEEVSYIKSLNRQYVTVDLDNYSSYDEKIWELKRRSQIFLSYSRQDFDLVRKLTKALQEIGFNILLDWEHFPAGESLQDTIPDAIRCTMDKGYFIPVISQDYLGRAFCAHELDTALSYNQTLPDQRIIPVCLDKETLDVFSSFNPLFCDGTDQGIMQLVKDIQQIDLKKNV